ncbi:Cytidylate kinase [Mucinivorans hirudinis]|uniref:Cytidylate kinase n=1 Tax=Mucinivorans hirudinis TaxID=1433126 RepID=A0A060R8Z4_9BACT|nr:Cytidylate kinase [Mucinivorans hirudinis]
MARIIIAVDGYSSCGKSTFARALAARYGYIFIDTGAMYRALTLYVINQGIVNSPSRIVEELDKIDISFKFNSQLGRSEIYLNGANVDSRIRSLEVSSHVSTVSAIPQVRDKLVALQQFMGRDKGVVMDGRDIGTVVFPQAELKIFMTADPKVRAMRRYNELQGREPFEEIERNIIERDHLDETRETSPLRRADDAVVLDNSNMTVEEQMEWAEQLMSGIRM